MPSRLMAGVVCVAAMSVHYNRVLSGGSFRIFRDLRLDLAAGLFILFLSVATVICIVPTLRRGTMRQAVIGMLLLLMPLWVSGHFLVWLYRRGKTTTYNYNALGQLENQTDPRLFTTTRLVLCAAVG